MSVYYVTHVEHSTAAVQKFKLATAELRPGSCVMGPVPRLLSFSHRLFGQATGLIDVAGRASRGMELTCRCPDTKLNHMQSIGEQGLSL